MNVSISTVDAVCAVLGFIHVAPSSRPKDWATRMMSIIDSQLAKKAKAVSRSPPCNAEQSMCPVMSAWQEWVLERSCWPHETYKAYTITDDQSSSLPCKPS